MAEQPQKPTLKEIIKAGQFCRFLLFFIIATGLLYGLYWWPPTTHWVHPNTIIANYLLVFLFIFAHYLTSLGLANDQQNLFTHFAAGMVVRFLLSIVVLSLYLVLFEFDNKILLSVNFVILYLTYIFFEIIFLLRILQSNSKKVTKL